MFVPYWGLYLQSNGLDNQAIGEITAAFLAMRIIAPNFWGWLADSTQQTMQIVRIIRSHDHFGKLYKSFTLKFGF